MLVEWINRHQPVWLEHFRLGAPLWIGPTGHLGLLLGPFHEWAPETIFVQLITKIDESGTHGAPFMVMAGYSALLNQWNRFDHKWQKALRKSKPPLEYFHTKDHLNHPFASKVTEIADSYLMFGFVVRMDLTDYKQVYRDGAWGGKAQPDSMYGLCFRYCLACVLDQTLAELPRDGLVLNFVIEEGHVNEGAPAEILRQSKRKQIPNFSEYLGVAVPGEKKRVPGLQAADSLATSAWQTELWNLPKTSLANAVALEALKPHMMMKCPVFYAHPNSVELAQFRNDYFLHVKFRQEFGRRKRDKSKP